MASSTENGPVESDSARARRLIAAARQRVEQSASEAETPRPELSQCDGPRDSSLLQVRCPHCQQAVTVADDTPWSQIVCRECGSSFSLIGSESSTVELGATLGRFELQERIGEGGFGSVWRARDSQLDRHVAIKVPRRGELTPSEVELFLREARATAQLRHPHIVSLHEVGREGPMLYLVSDLIVGQPLSERLRQRMSVADAVDLCQKIAHALHYAHTMGIVHRDLKPANILLDVRGEPHLTDFGLAKRDAGEVTMTIDGQLVGTPAYMSPEQAGGHSHDADARSDIYSLGVMLFEMLTGELPFRGSPRMVVDKVLHSDPPSPRSLNNQVPPDLQTICLKCLEKQPSARYATAADLAADLVRFQRRERISARPVGAVRRLSRWYGRHPVLANLAVAVVALAVIGPAIAWQQSRLVLRESQARARGDQYLYVAHMNNVQDACEAADYGRAVALLNQHRPAPGGDDLRSFEWYHWWEVCHRGLLQEISTGEQIRALAVPPDGRLIAVGGSGGRITLWDRLSDKAPLILDGHTETVTGLDFSADGRWLASSSQDKFVRLWDVESGKCVDTIADLPDGVRGVAFSRDGARLAVAILNGTAQIWDVVIAKGSEAEPIAQFARPARQALDVQTSRKAGEKILCYSVAWDSSGQHLATGSGGVANWTKGEMQWWNLETSECEARVATERPCDYLACSPAGDLIAVRDTYGSVALWDPVTREIRHRLACPTGDVFAPVFTADGARLAALSERGSLICWDVESERVVESWPGHTSPVFTLACLAEENLFVTGGFDGKARIWQSVPRSHDELTPAHSKGVTSLAFLPDGARLVTGSRDGELRTWNVADGSQIESLGKLSDSSGVAAISPDGKTLAYADKQSVAFWDFGAKQTNALLLEQREPVACLAFSPDSKFLAAGGGVAQSLWPGEPTDLRIWNIESRHVLHELSGNRRLVRCVAFSPDGRTLATGGFDRRVLVWDVATGELRRTLDTQGVFNVMCLTISPDSRELAYGAHDGSVWLADLRSESPPRRIIGQDGAAWAVAYSPDGKSLAAAFGQQVQGINERSTIKLWDTSTTELKLRLTSKNGPPQSLTFAPDGQILVAGFNDGTVHLWRGPRDESR